VVLAPVVLAAADAEVVVPVVVPVVGVVVAADGVAADGDAKRLPALTIKETTARVNLDTACLPQYAASSSNNVHVVHASRQADF